jgi:hypothetical protein
MPADAYTVALDSHIRHDPLFGFALSPSAAPTGFDERYTGGS